MEGNCCTNKAHVHIDNSILLLTLRSIVDFSRSNTHVHAIVALVEPQLLFSYIEHILVEPPKRLQISY